MSYDIKWEGSNIIIHFDSTVSSDDIIEVDNVIYGDPRFDKMKFQIFDFTRCIDVLLTKKDLETIAVLDRSSSRWNNNVKVAIVSCDPKMKIVKDTYASLMKGTNWEAELFTTLSDALSWCNTQ